MPSLRLLTCAKVNLFLRVLGKRGDGYHAIQTVFHGIDLCDELSFDPGPRGSLQVRARFGAKASGALPAPEDNLVTRAWAELDGPSRETGATVEISKRIPVGAGLGGGSSNAAGTLVALDELWGLGLGQRALEEKARAVGSDVAYFLRGGTALGSGRGEVLESIASGRGLWFVLGISHRGLSTKDVYALWRPGNGAPRDARPILEAVRSGELEAIAACLHNDLEPCALALRPELAAKKAALLRAGALAAIVSGSGPTVLGLVADEADAREVARGVEEDFDRVEVVRSRHRCLERLR